MTHSNRVSIPRFAHRSQPTTRELNSPMLTGKVEFIESPTMHHGSMFMILLYLDYNCFQRSFDDPTQIRIQM